ncbi:MAG TPA: ATP-binding protein [Coleofasciculaceae cyanobacterium]|jgi:signal transduction histidine kinase
MQYFSRSLYKSLAVLPVRQRGILIISIPVACLFMALAAFTWLKASIVSDESEVQETQQVQIETKQLATALLNAEAAMQSYGITQRQELLNAYNASLETIPDTLDELERLVQDNPQQEESLLEIRQRVDQSLSFMQQKINIQRDLATLNGGKLPAAALVDWLEEGKALMSETHAEIEQFTEEEESLLEERKQSQAFYRQITWVVLCLSAIVSTGGGLLAIYLFRQLEQELAAQQCSLQRSNQQLQRFTANASHELRAPLAAVLSNAQVGLMAEPDDLIEPRTRLENIVELTKSMSTLVTDLLFLARHEGSQIELTFQPVDLTHLLQALTEEWSGQAIASHLDLSYQPMGTPITVYADSGLLKQAIANLLCNACHYTPAGGKIQLRLLTHSQQALIEVEDTGMGIPAEDLSHIFERFYRVEAKRTNSGGFGLGLAIAQQIIQAHGGRIIVSSILEQGSKFQVVLPLTVLSPPPSSHLAAFAAPMPQL